MPSTETQRRRLVIGLIGLAMIAVIVIGALLFVRGRAAVDDLNAQVALLQRAGDSSETLYEWAGEDARAEAASLRGFVLPAEADDLKMARQGQLRPIYWLRFSLLPDALSAFLTTTCIEQLEGGARPAFRYGAHENIIANLPWWLPDSAQHVAGGDCADDSGIRYRLLADLDAGTNATVYMEISPEQR